jgi:5-methylcytosine-specific restriction endonuclease McrA
MQSAGWRRRRAQALRRTGRRCQECGARATDVHHLTYAHLGDERPDELIAVCESCHNRLHGRARTA